MFINKNIFGENSPEPNLNMSLSKTEYDMDEFQDFIRPAKSGTNYSRIATTKALNTISYTNKIEQRNNPIVTNFLANEGIFSNNNSDSDNHSCQLSIHDDCPIHGSGNSYNCPVHGSTSEIKDNNDSLYNWNCILNDKNLVKCNYHTYKTVLDSTNSYESQCSPSLSYPIQSTQMEIKNLDSTILTENISIKH